MLLKDCNEKECIAMTFAMYNILTNHDEVLVPSVVNGSAFLSFVYKDSGKIVTFDPLMEKHGDSVSAAISYSLKLLLKTGDEFVELPKSLGDIEWTAYVPQTGPRAKTNVGSLGVVAAMIFQTSLGNPYQYICEETSRNWLNYVFRFAVCGDVFPEVYNNNDPICSGKIKHWNQLEIKSVTTKLYWRENVNDLKIQPRKIE